MIRSFAFAILFLGCAATRSVPAHANTGTDEREATEAGSMPRVWAEVGLNREDAEHLVNESLRLVIERKCPLGDLHFLADPKRVPVFAADVRSLYLRPVGDVSFEPVSERTLGERAEANGSYVYYFRFAKVFRQDSTIMIELINVPQYAAKPERAAFGSGVTIEFSRRDGEWVHTCTAGWIA